MEDTQEESIQENQPKEEEVEEEEVKTEWLDLESTEFKLHPLAAPTGGVSFTDKDSVISRTVKDVASKIASNALKGEIKEMINIPTPAYVHQA